MRRILLLTVLAILGSVAPADANPYGDFGIDFTNTVWRRDVERGWVTSKPGGRASGRAVAPVSTIVPRRAAQIPAQMASTSPPAQRAQMQQYYTQLLSAYELMAQKLQIADRDLTGPLALLVCASYGAYRDVEVPEAGITATAKQLHDTIGGRLAQLPVAQRQDLYEKTAILSAMIIAGAEAGKTDPTKREQVKTLAKQFLAGFVDPDRVQITAKGMSLPK